ncbi:MAG: AraC family transcriptional regulator [Gammaproteobacteria bacterium HGW-Gammaproteobacteria-11]|nr:MAG: AraC family transcriptional regulator [Gammaproteobacteria bacterium HGW-Gammaproteobacteria-11]
MHGFFQVPFAQQTLLRSGDYDEAVDQINGNLGEQRTVAPLGRRPQADIHITLQALPAIKLFGAQWGDRVNIRSTPLASWHAILPLSGGVCCRQGEQQAAAGELLLFAPEHEVDVTWQAGTRAIVMAADTAHLGRYLQEQHQLEAPRITRRILHIPRTDPAMRTLGLLLQMTDGELGAADSVLKSASGERHLQSLFCETLIKLVPEFTSQPARALLPGLLKRVVDHIQANLDQSLTVEDLVAISGASRRSLEQAFRQNLQTSPMRYLLQCRLEAARSTLRAARSGDVQLSELAFRLGFSQPSHFTHAYKKAFAELPSETRAL